MYKSMKKKTREVERKKRKEEIRKLVKSRVGNNRLKIVCIKDKEKRVEKSKSYNEVEKEDERRKKRRKKKERKKR